MCVMIPPLTWVLIHSYSEVVVERDSEEEEEDEDEKEEEMEGTGSWCSNFTCSGKLKFPNKNIQYVYISEINRNIVPVIRRLG